MRNASEPSDDSVKHVEDVVLLKDASYLQAGLFATLTSPVTNSKTKITPHKSNELITNCCQ